MQEQPLHAFQINIGRQVLCSRKRLGMKEQKRQKRSLLSNGAASCCLTCTRSSPCLAWASSQLSITREDAQLLPRALASLPAKQLHEAVRLSAEPVLPSREHKV
eukprot:1011911-Pleurochrysis_carterae.AAC.1